MASGGFYLMHRGWMENAVFSKEPFTECQAWVWLIERAAWGDAVHSVGRRRVKVGRGQIAVSVRYLAEAWQWSKSRVGRFLERLKNETMIGTAIEPDYTLITICNYRRYQEKEPEEEPARGTDGGTGAGQERDKYNDKSLNEDKEASLAARGRERPAGSDADGPTLAEKRAFADWLLPYLDVPETYPIDRIRLWLGKGLGLGQIRQVIESVTTRNRDAEPGWRPRGLKYFDGAMDEALRKPAPREPLDAMTEQWRMRVRTYRDKGLWVGPWGDRPEERDCIAPRAVLVEFGYREGK